MTDHPILPAGYNADDNNGDEVDGAGTNWTVWPVLFDAFIPLNVFILTEEMLEVFEGCADYTVSWVDMTTTIPAEDGFVLLSDRWPDTIVAYVNGVLTLRAEDDVLQVTDKWGDFVVPSTSRLGA